jgi:dTDP-glucose pyrophosphorylase
MKPTLLILAAGVGSRYGGLKQVDGMGPNGEAILEYSVSDAIKAGFGKVVFVIRKDIESEFRRIVGHRVEARIHTEYAFQEKDTALEWLADKPHREKPWGTGHAILSARAHVREPFVAINADDYYGADAFSEIGHFLREHCSPSEYGMVAYQLGNTLSENGAVSRGVCDVDDQGFLRGVTERTQIERRDEGIAYFHGEAWHSLPEKSPVSMNFWGCHHSVMDALDAQFRDFVAQNMDKPKAEFYIPSVINKLIQDGQIRLRVLHSHSQWYGVTYPEDKQTVQAALRAL